ncbi:hypothetical protein, partial [Paraburkholderia mimosarum]|uniref:hypothetical protein n=1 Tax=Paraburkholderia mimosarum TaxID=312026 RepID=UPI001ABB870C
PPRLIRSISTPRINAPVHYSEGRRKWIAYGRKVRPEEKPAFREMTSKKKHEEKTLSHRHFLTTFRLPMTRTASV